MKKLLIKTLLLILFCWNGNAATAQKVEVDVSELREQMQREDFLRALGNQIQDTLVIVKNDNLKLSKSLKATKRKIKFYKATTFITMGLAFYFSLKI